MCLHLPWQSVPWTRLGSGSWVVMEDGTNPVQPQILSFSWSVMKPLMVVFLEWISYYSRSQCLFSKCPLVTVFPVGLFCSRFKTWSCCHSDIGYWLSPSCFSTRLSCHSMSVPGTQLSTNKHMHKRPFFFFENGLLYSLFLTDFHRVRLQCWEHLWRLTGPHSVFFGTLIVSLLLLA